MMTSGGKEGLMTVGLDVGDKNIHACFLDGDGTVAEESRLAATASALRRRFSGGECYRIILEAGVHSPWMSRLLLDLGHEEYVANPRRLRAIYENESKSDRVDAPVLGSHRAPGPGPASPPSSTARLRLVPISLS